MTGIVAAVLAVIAAIVGAFVGGYKYKGTKVAKAESDRRYKDERDAAEVKQEVTDEVDKINGGSDPVRDTIDLADRVLAED